MLTLGPQEREIIQLPHPASSVIPFKVGMRLAKTPCCAYRSLRGKRLALEAAMRSRGVPCERCQSRLVAFIADWKAGHR
jgi:hypothetical protein